MKLWGRTIPGGRGRSERGVALLLVMVVTGIAFLVVASVLSSSSTSAQMSIRAIAHAESMAAADAALEAAVALMRRDLLVSGTNQVANKVATDQYPPEIFAVVMDQLTGITSLEAAVQSLGATNTGELRFEITVQAETTNAVAGRSRVSMDLRMIDLPITAFEYFYDLDLEHYAWHDWVVTGPVYGGSTNYFRPTGGIKLTFAEKVFAAGPIVTSGLVEFLSDKLEQAPSVVPMGPVGATNRMRWILEEPVFSDYGTSIGNQRFVNKADVIVRLTDAGVTIHQGPRHGNVFVDAVLPDFCVQTHTNRFFDGRELRWTSSVELNAGAVPAWMVQVFGGAAPSHPVIYISDRRSPVTGSLATGFNSVRIHNGEVLGGNGFTLATPNALYIWGHFNKDSPKPAMLASDALTVLSGAWADDSSQYGYTALRAVDTTVNAAVLTGIIPAGIDYGSGWVANVLRLLEDWESAPRRTLTFRGSTSVLFQSEEAAGRWSMDYYSAPEREFRFVDHFAGLLLTDVPTVKLVVRSDYRILPPL